MKSKILSTLAIKRWLQRKQRHYKTATNDYVQRLRDALEKSEKLDSLNVKAITLLVASSLASTKLEGVTIKRSDLPNAKVDERVRLITENKDAIGGRILIVSSTEVKIKFDEPLLLSKANTEDGKKTENDKDVTTTTNTCESPPAIEATKERDEGDEKADEKHNEIIEENHENHVEDEIKSPHKVKVEFEPNSVILKKVQVTRALKKFKKVSCSLPIHKFLLGNYKDRSNVKFNKTRRLSIRGLLEPKGNQALAIEQSMMKRISLIEGVTGGGKSQVAAHIACSMSRLMKRKVLLCSPVPATVERLAQMINSTTGTNVVQLPQFPRYIDDRIEENHDINVRNRRRQLYRKYKNGDCCLLDARVNDAIFHSSLKRLSPLNNVGYRRAWQRKNAEKMVINSSPWQRRRVERLVLSEADVICCSPCQAGGYLMKGLKFDMLIIDDVEFASEIDCLVPIMLKGIKQVTLLSDIRREILLARSNSTQQANSIGRRQSVANSSDVVANKNRTSLPLNKPNGRLANSTLKKVNRLGKTQTSLDVKQAHEPGSLFERFLSMGLSSVTLNHQYRMQGTLSVFPSYQFYSSRLKDDELINKGLLNQIASEFFDDEDQKKSFDWIPKRDCLTALFDTKSTEETVHDIVSKLIHKENIIESRIGVIMNSYKAYEPSGNENKGIQVGTVEDFYGQERDFIILSSESNSNYCADSKIDLDYLKNDIALKIALTRPKLGLFIVADLKSMMIDKNCQFTASGSDDNSCLNQRAICCKSWQKLVEFYQKNKLVT